MLGHVLDFCRRWITSLLFGSGCAVWCLFCGEVGALGEHVGTGEAIYVAFIAG